MNTKEETATIAPTNDTTVKTTPIVLGAFGNGRYSKAMSELFRDTKRLLGFSEKQAHAVAARLGIDVGRLAQGDAALSLGKSVSKDGYRTLKETCSIKAPNSWAMSVAVVCNGLDSLRKQGLDCGEGNSMNKEIMEFVNQAAQRLIVA